MQRHVKTRRIEPAVDRGVIDGFASYLTAHSSYKAGVYSAPPVWSGHLRHRQRGVDSRPVRVDLHGEHKQPGATIRRHGA